MPQWAWLIYAAIAIFAGLVIYLAEGGRPSRRALAAWLASVLVFAVSAEAIELYVSAASAAK